MSGTHATAKRGSDHYAARLTEDDVRLIRAAGRERRRLLDDARRLSDAELAAKFECGVSTISRILSRQLWAHVE